MDYPQTRGEYTPFLNREVEIDHEGNLDTRLYRKPQKKVLTLHAKAKITSPSVCLGTHHCQHVSNCGQCLLKLNEQTALRGDG